MKSNIIAFTGEMGSGKSEAIKTLINSVDKSIPVVLVKFAQPLYDIQEYIYNRVSSVVKRQKTFTKDRYLLQWLGTEWGRNTIDKNLWVLLWKAKVKEVLANSPNAIIVCDDCRFDNEAEVVKAIEGCIIKISTSKNNERIDTSLITHPSENGISLNYVDFVIENNSTLENYKNQLTCLFNKLDLNK